MITEKGVEVDHSTINRWVLKFAPELDKRIRFFLNPTNDSWRVDETYVEVKEEWKYLYRAVDSAGNTLDFVLNAKRDGKAAARIFRRVLGAKRTQTPRGITVDKKVPTPAPVPDTVQVASGVSRSKTLPVLLRQLSKYCWTICLLRCSIVLVSDKFAAWN